MITPLTLELFSKKHCDEWEKTGASNTPLAYHHDVDFDILSLEAQVKQGWTRKAEQECVVMNIGDYAATHVNIIEQYNIRLKVVKDGSNSSDNN